MFAEAAGAHGALQVRTLVARAVFVAVVVDFSPPPPPLGAYKRDRRGTRCVRPQGNVNARSIW